MTIHPHVLLRGPLQVALCTLLGASPLVAQDVLMGRPSDPPPPAVATGSGCFHACCPDDYCRKPPPCAWFFKCFLPDNYCPKPCLCLPCPEPCCCPDDYDRKPCPAANCQAAYPWYKCVPDAQCCLPLSKSPPSVR
jgi:hypothetical protein